MTDTQTQTDPQTALEIIHREYTGNPGRSTLAIGNRGKDHYNTGFVIGAWDKTQERFVMVACQAITGEWVTMPVELLINGAPPQVEWTPIPAPQA